jgi:DNA repair exonuclease SbcCD ATPase subunit
MKGTCTRCGKQNVDPIFPHTCTPKALELAELLEQNALMPLDDVAAAELRRLHEEAEELRYDRKELRKIADILEAQERFLGSWDSIVKQAFARIDSDEARLQQALDALEEKNRPLRRIAVDFEAIAADQAMTIELDKVLMQQALEALKKLQYAATTDKAFAMADAAIDALKERLK